MTDLNNSVIMPREDFIELSSVAYDSHIPSFGERSGQVIQATFVMAAFAGAITAAAWGVVKAQNWFEQNQANRKREQMQFEIDNHISTNHYNKVPD